MAIGERINFLRNLRGMTMKFFGMSIGFTESQADVRISQYESGKRTPKENVIADMAKSLNVSPEALDVPNIDSYTGLMHTFFALEDIYGLRIGEIDGEICLRLSKTDKAKYTAMFDMLSTWNKVSQKYKDEQISKEEYDQWRYNYPQGLVEETTARLEAHRKGEKMENTTSSTLWVKMPPDLDFSEEE